MQERTPIGVRSCIMVKNHQGFPVKEQALHL
jgi:hypothetical protein